LDELSNRYPFVANVRGKGLLLGADLLADAENLVRFAKPANVNLRLVELAYQRGLIIYSRRIRGDGVEADNFMLAPPLIITAPQLDELTGILESALQALSAEIAQGLGAA
jgi:adenosylmethionine-8-amino-7-oxononanoate aminotransferase